MLAELDNIHPDVGSVMEAYLLPVYVQRVAGQGLPESIEGPAENGPAAGPVILGPKKVDQ
jgi:hypothetical protein